MSLDICPQRPNQRPYVEATIYANIDGLFHANEDNPQKLKGYQMRIHTTTEVPQKTLRQQTFNGIEKAFLRVKQELLILYGQIEPSESAYKTPLVLVQHKQRVRDFLENHGDNAFSMMNDPAFPKIVEDFYRLTVNLKMLNSVTVADSQPMPLCRDILDEFVGCLHFTSMDLKDAFWTVPVHPDDRHKTAFATHDMLLQWCVCPQGSKNGATVFARIIKSIFRGKPEEISVYQDDIFNHSKNILKHLEGLEFTFGRLRQRGLFAKVTQCT
jgi:hypothetical protein